MSTFLYAGDPAGAQAQVEVPSSLRLLTEIAADERSVPVPPTAGHGVMDTQWVELWAGVGESIARHIDRRWLRETDPNAAQDPVEVETITGLVRDIADVCRAAQAGKLPVVCAEKS